MSRKAVWLAGLVGVAVLMLPATASAAVCTDTWTGPAEGTWQTAADWSAEHVPTSSDVACVGAKETVRVTEGANQAGIVQVEGTLVVAGGSLEVSNALEVSVVSRLAVEGGALTGAATVDVSGELSWTGGTMSGSGSTVLLSGSTGSLALTSSAFLATRSFINEGTVTLSSGQLWLSEGAELRNPGTFDCNSSSGIEAGSGASVILNTGVFQKTEGEWTTVVSPKFENSGTLAGSSGTLEFASGTELVLNGKGVVKGTILLAGASVTGGSFDGHGAAVTFSGGTFTVTTGSTASVGKLSLTGGTLTGPGRLEVSGELLWSSGTMSGAGSLVVLPGATGVLSSGSLFLVERTFVNEGSVTMGSGQLWMSEGSRVANAGTFTMNSSNGVATSGSGGTIVNSGVFQKTEGAWSTEIEASFENLGRILELEGKFVFPKIISIEASTQYGGNNPSGSGQEHPACGEPVNCATGNLFDVQTDLAVGGRGVGLALTRTYNSQAGAAGLSGLFGPGWSGSFTDHLVVEAGKATLHQANGSTVLFAEGKGESFTSPSWSQDSLSGNSTAGYSLILANQVKYQFEGSTGRLQRVTDRNGNQTTLGYEKAGRLETITDPASRKITLTYNGEGFVESAKDPMGNTVKYTYEGGNLVSVTEPGEAKARWQYHYDGSHQMTSVTDGRAGKTTNEYDASHRVTSQTDPTERLLSFEYEPFHTKITNHSTGSVTDERFTSADLPYSITHGFGTASATTETFTYDAANNLTSVTDGNNHKTEYTYDSAANRKSVIDPDEHETKWTYDQTHDVLTVTDPSGETTTVARDSHGNAEKVSRPAPGKSTQTTTYAYDVNGNVKSMVDPLKHTWSYEYNNPGDRTSETDPEGDKRTYGYNEDSRMTSMVSPNGNVKGAEASQYTTKIERDAQGRPTTITDPLGHTTKYAYDGNGNLETLTDGNTHTTTYTYNADNRPTKVKEPNTTTIETGYDGAQRVTSKTDGNKHTTTFVRNILGEVIEVKDPLGRVTKKEYDASGNLTSQTDAAKRTTKYAYDPADRFKEISYSDGKTPTVKYEYDANGNRIKMTDGTGKTSYTYDLLNRLVQSTDRHGDNTGYEYDLAGNQTKLTYPNKNLLTRAYDNTGRLQSVTDWLKNTTTFAYNPNSDLTTTTFPKATGEQDKVSYNATDQQMKITMTGNGLKVRASLAYTRDNDGQIKSTTTTGLPGTESISNTYDANNRLEKASSTAYAYDSADEPTTLGSNSSVYDAGNELKTSGNNIYGYDQLGRRVSATPKGGQATTYGYDQAGDLIQVKQGKAGGLNVNYAYDGNGLRTSQTKGKTTSYITWDTHVELTSILSDEQNSYIYGPANIPIEQIQSKGVVLYLHHDQQGSTRMLTSENGASEATTTYDAYGNTTGATGNTTSPLGYDGQYTNADTGLIYLRARSYDPTTAQFLNVDPIDGITSQPYTYADDNPLNLFDPSGLSACGSIAVISTICNGLQKSGISEAAAGALSFITLGTSTELAGSIFGFNSDCTDFGAAGSVGEGLAFGLGLFDGESEAELAARGAEELASTGRTTAADLKEQLAMEQAKSDPAAGIVLSVKMSDPRWLGSNGWVKMAQDINGVEIHYVRNTTTGAVADFKFKGGTP